MAKKYIKSKDGKFQGSVSDGKSVPTSVPGKLPSKPSITDSPQGDYKRISDLYASKVRNSGGEQAANDLSAEAWRGETGGASLFVNERIDTISGTVSETPGGRFLGSVDVTYVDRESTIATEVFDNPYDAESWVAGEVNTRAEELYEFQQAYAYDPVGMDSMADKVLLENPSWHEEKHEVFGVPIGSMRSPKRGATVQRLGDSGYLVMVHDYANASDQEGEMYIQQHLPDFNTAWAYSRHLCAKTI